MREILGMTGVALVALVGLRLLGVLSPVPIALLVAVIVAATVLPSLAENWGPARRFLSLGARVGVQIVSTTAVIYTTGWGPVLSVGYVFCAAQSVALEGSSAVFPATVWSLACLAAAQIGIALGWVPSVISDGKSAGIAVLMAAGLVFVMRILWVSASEREAATAALAQSEDRFRRLLTNAADAVVVLDETGMIVFATEAIQTLIGYSVDELVGRRDASVIIELPRTWNAMRAETGDALRRSPGMSLSADVRVHHRDGGVRWCQLSMANRLDDPVIHGIVVNVHDITQRREAEASVAAAEARFRSLVQHAADGIMILGPGGRCEYVSPSYERLTGHDSNQLLGELMREYGHPDDLAVVSAAWARLVEHPDETIHVEARVKHADGRFHWQAMSISNRLDDPTFAGMIVNVRDVTDRKALDDLLAEESRILGMIAWAEPLESVLDRAASITAAYTGARFCLIRLFDGDTLRLAAAPNFPPELYEQIALVAVDAQMPSARAALDRAEIFVTDTVADPAASAVSDLAATLGIAASWSVPIELPNRNAVAGTMTLLFGTSDDDRGVHRPLVDRVVSLAAVAIEQAQALEELEHRAFHDELTGLPNRALLNDRLNPRAPALTAPGHGSRGAVPRSRPVQARQRQPRARRRRPAAHPGREASPGQAASRHRRTSRRRRVRRPRRRRPCRERRACGGAKGRRHPGAALRGRRRDHLRQCQRRGRARARCRARRRRAPAKPTARCIAKQRGRGSVEYQSTNGTT